MAKNPPRKSSVKRNSDADSKTKEVLMLPPIASHYGKFIKAWKTDKTLVIKKLGYFADCLANDPQAPSHVHGLIRGHELLKNAKAWSAPVIGSGKSAKFRGLQWKLVMTYNGMELLIKSLLQKPGTDGLREDDLTNILSKLPLPELEPLNPPSLKRKSLATWLVELDKDAVIQFLKTSRGDKTQIEKWLLEQQPIVTWKDAILLTKALRNCTAHGALSPSKVQEWGLGDAFKHLPQALFKIDAVIFETLVR
jgi:hypothetical protein